MRVLPGRLYVCLRFKTTWCHPRVSTSTIQLAKPPRLTYPPDFLLTCAVSSPESADVLPVQEEPAHAVPTDDHRPLLPQRCIPLRGVHPRRMVHPRPCVLYHHTVSVRETNRNTNFDRCGSDQVISVEKSARYVFDIWQIRHIVRSYRKTIRKPRATNRWKC